MTYLISKVILFHQIFKFYTGNYFQGSCSVRLCDGCLLLILHFENFGWFNVSY